MVIFTSIILPAITEGLMPCVPELPSAGAPAPCSGCTCSSSYPHCEDGTWYELCENGACDTTTANNYCRNDIYQWNYCDGGQCSCSDNDYSGTSLPSFNPNETIETIQGIVGLGPFIHCILSMSVC